MTYSVKWAELAPPNRQTLCYFMPPKHVISNLEHRRIKLSNFSSCNDVFELASFSLENKELRAPFKRWSTEIDKMVKLLCLSEGWRSPLMWSHYADRGRGVCLVFDVLSGFAKKVKYTPKRLSTPNGFKFPPFGHDNFETFCTHKGSMWGYEAEYRILAGRKKWVEAIVDGEKCHFLSFSGDIRLKGVINGPRATLGSHEITQHLSDSQNYFEARPAFTKFGVVSQQKKGLWKK